ncbi:MAG: hypothetical protein OXQ29_22690 [Rhodospirillaceae bacterium]|nr:hypothetical protein [Rhodospirillaceae bacterium]
MPDKPENTNASVHPRQTSIPILSKLFYRYDHAEPKNHLSTLELTFTPKGGLQTSLKQINHFGSSLFEYYKRPLDLIYQDLPSGQCDSYAHESSYGIISFGYKYAALPCQLSKRQIRQYATKIFDSSDFPTESPGNSHTPFNAEISSNHGASDNPNKIPDVTIELHLHPILNQFFLDYTKNIPHLQYNTSAAESLNNLYSLLQTTSAPTIEHLFSIVPKRPKPNKPDSIPF